MSNFKFNVGDRVTVTDHHGYRPGQEFVIVVRGRSRNNNWYTDGTDVGAWPGVYEDGLRLVKPGEVVEDSVNHPAHYNSHPSGVECIEIARHHNFNIGNVFKYLWRIGLKGKDAASKEKQVEEIDKAIFYLQDERKRILAS